MHLSLFACEIIKAVHAALARGTLQATEDRAALDPLQHFACYAPFTRCKHVIQCMPPIT